MLDVIKMGGTLPLDMTFNYSPDYAYYFFSKLGAEGRLAYIRFLVFIDMLFPLCYGLISALIYKFFLDRIFRPKNSFKLLVFLPIFGASIDIMENIMQLVMLRTYPIRFVTLAGISSLFTSFKLIGMFIYALLFILLPIILFFKRVIKKKNSI